MQTVRVKKRQQAHANIRKHSITRGRLSSKRRKKTSKEINTAFRSINTSLLKPESFYTAERFFINLDNDNDNDYLLFPTNESIIRCIEDIYPIIKEDIGIFVAQVMPTIHSSPLDVLNQLLDKYSEIQSKDYDIRLENGRYYIVIRDEYDISESGFSLPAEPFFIKRRKYPNLYKAFLTMCGQLYKSTNFWDDMHHEQAVEVTEEDAEYREEVEDYKIIMKEYKFALNALGSAVKKNAKLTDKMIDKIELEQFKPWFKMAQNLIKIDDKLYNYIHGRFTSETEYPANVIQCHSFLWSWNDSNPIWYWVDSDFENQANEYGYLNFSVLHYLNKDNTKETPKSDYPYLFNEFMKEGCELIKFL